MNVGWQNKLARLYARPGTTLPAPATKPDTVLVHSITDAPVAGTQSKYPVILFAAGWGVLPLEYSSVIEELVSHGYIVAGVVFTYYAPYVVFSDGDVAGQHEFAIDLPGVQRYVSAHPLTAERIAALQAQKDAAPTAPEPLLPGRDWAALVKPCAAE